MLPTPMATDQLKSSVDIGSEFEVEGMEEGLKCGVVKWLEVYNYMYKEIVGLEMVC